MYINQSTIVRIEKPKNILFASLHSKKKKKSKVKQEVVCRVKVNISLTDENGQNVFVKSLFNNLKISSELLGFLEYLSDQFLAI